MRESLRVAAMHRWVWLLVVGIAGCFDFGQLGGADLSADLGVPVEPPCGARADCPTGSNCIDGDCVPALATCGALAQAHPDPALADGVYWVMPVDQPHLAYCDMQLGASLCDEQPGGHKGRTRDGSNLALDFESKLTEGGHACDLWSIRSNGRPLAPLNRIDGVHVDTCQALGFAGNVTLGKCAFGYANSQMTCGFDNTGWMRYGNLCPSCDMGTGQFTHWVLQGPIAKSDILSDADGQIPTRCLTDWPRSSDSDGG